MHSSEGFQKQRGFAGADHYGGIPIFASPGVHEACAVLALKYCPPPAKAVDLAAGQGAFTRRLLDLHYQVLANDLDHYGWRVPEIQPALVDLNAPFAEGFQGRADLVVAIEVIEHLENPRQFLRECRALLSPRGVAVLSLPNLLDYDSRHLFARRGEFTLFTPAKAVASGHISPLPAWLLEQHASAAGLAVLEKVYAGRKVRSTLRARIMHGLLSRAASLLLRGTNWQELSHNNVAYAFGPARP